MRQKLTSEVRCAGGAQPVFAKGGRFIKRPIVQVRIAPCSQPRQLHAPGPPLDQIPAPQRKQYFDGRPLLRPLK